MAHAVICPTVTATNLNNYREQMERLQPFAKRIHIDLMDGEFAPTSSPDISHIWWPPEFMADIHLMYQRPMDYLSQLIKLKPHMVVIHNEAEVHHVQFAAELHQAGIQAGLAVLSDTPIDFIYQIMHSFDQILIFSGNLGYQGGSAVNLALLDKVAKAKEQYPEAEIAWDGGINQDNIAALVKGGVDVLNVGGFIQNSSDPKKAYATLEALVHDT
jgi:ribulose-phosphate 3-epimerase